MNRRDFLKSTAATVIAVPLAASLPVPVEAIGYTPTDEKRVKLFTSDLVSDISYVTVRVNRLEDYPLDKPGWARRMVVIQNYDGLTITVEPMLNGESFEENGIIYLRSYRRSNGLLFVDRRLILVANRRVDGGNHTWDIIDARGDEVTAQSRSIALYYGALGESFQFFE